MYIVFDSNIWFSEFGLNSPKGAAARFYVKSKGARVVVPEVVRLETERNLKSELIKYTSEISKKYRQLLKVFGTLKEIVLPDEKAIDEKVKTVFEQCQLDLLEIPLTMESARSSFLKTIDKIPPSDKAQQFKDGVIWADCLRLLEEDDVYLVTSDKAFYQNRQYENGLAMPLTLEAKKHSKEMKLFPSIEELIQDIKTDFALDEQRLVAEFVATNEDSINDILSKNGFATVGEPVINTTLYATEQPNKLYLEFDITYECEDLSCTDRSDAELRLKGDATYMVDANQFSTLRNFGEEFVFKTRDGEEKSVRNVVVLAASLVIGHKTIEHTVKYKLD